MHPDAYVATSDESNGRPPFCSTNNVHRHCMGKEASQPIGFPVSEPPLSFVVLILSLAKSAP